MNDLSSPINFVWFRSRMPSVWFVLAQTNSETRHVITVQSVNSDIFFQNSVCNLGESDCTNKRGYVSELFDYCMLFAMHLSFIGSCMNVQ